MLYAVAVVLLVALCTLGGLLWTAVHYRRIETRADPGLFPPVSCPDDCDAIATDLVQQMSLGEKLAQLSGDLSTRRFSFRYVASLLLGHGVPLAYSGYNRRLGIPPLSFSDGPRGVGVGRGKTCFPVTMARGATFNPALEQQVGMAMGRELRASGANYSGAVCVNLLRHPGWGRAQETYGEDSYHLGEMGLALTRGLQSRNVMACVKHFALNSIENSRFYVDVNVDERSLREVYLPHFRKIVEQGQVASVMSAYNKFRGEYCGHSRELLTDILRDDWGFKGFVTSDWMHGVRDGVKGIRAGLDLEMPSPVRYGKPLLAALRRGELSEADIDARVHPVLRTRLWYALAPDTEDYDAQLLACDDHVRLARRVAEESMVLLKNDGVLPLDPARVRRLGVFGQLAALENTGDRGSSAVAAPRVVTPLEGLSSYMQEQGGEVVFADGKDTDAARVVAEGVDAAVVVVGLTWADEGEWFVLQPEKKAAARRLKFIGGGGDRTSLRLRARDEALIAEVAAVQPHTVVVCVGGSAVDVSWREQVGAILFSFYSGMEGGHALASLLFGDANPSGRLPFTIPESDADLPEFLPFAESATYGPLHGYSLFEKKALPVAYPFGHGLGYSEFSLSELEVDTRSDDWTVTVTLVNCGDVSGAEVVQVYLAFPESAVDRPPKKLAAFQKVLLSAGQRATVTMVVDAQARQVYDPDAGEWVMPDEPVELLVGRSSADISLRHTFLP